MACYGAHPRTSSPADAPARPPLLCLPAMPAHRTQARCTLQRWYTLKRGIGLLWSQMTPPTRHCATCDAAAAAERVAEAKHVTRDAPGGGFHGWAGSLAIAAERREQALTCWSTAMDAISDARLGRPSLPLSPGDCPLLSSREGPMREALKEGECPDDPGPASRAMRRACGSSPRVIRRAAHLCTMPTADVLNADEQQCRPVVGSNACELYVAETLIFTSHSTATARLQLRVVRQLRVERRAGMQPGVWQRRCWQRRRIRGEAAQVPGVL